MSIGRFVTNPGVIAAAFGAFGTARQTKSMPKDWRRVIVWGIWAASLLLALVSVVRQVDDEEFEAAQKDAERALKAEAKAQRRS